MSDGLKDSFSTMDQLYKTSAGDLGQFVHCGCMSTSQVSITCSKHQLEQSGENTITFTTSGVDLTKEGMKFDNGKPILALVPATLEQAVGEILTMGAAKYAPNNWKKGIKYTRIVSSLKRHLNEFYQGNLIDSESGKPHLWHAACNMAFLIEFESKPEKYKEFNDL